MTGAPIDKQLRPVDDEALGMPVPRFISAADLDAKTFPPLRFIVPGILVEGLTILAGKPKAGKSWLCLDLALAVAIGGVALGSVRCQEGDVLYAALEDNQRRLQSRVRQVYLDPQKPGRLHFVTEMPPLNDGCLAVLDAWMAEVKEPRLIILDTLGILRGSTSGGSDRYQEDYQLLAGLQHWALEKRIAVLLVHHTRKMEAEDPFDQVSGTQGLTGASDSILVLKKEASGCTLYGRGRDIEEFAHAVRQDPRTSAWEILGDAAEVRRSTQRQTILEVLDGSAEPLGPTEIADGAGMKLANVKTLLSKMAKSGEIEKVDRGKYRTPDLSGAVPVDAEGSWGNGADYPGGYHPDADARPDDH